MADIDIEIVTEIEGLDALEEAFTQGSKRTVREFLRGVEMKAAKPLMDNAKAAAPYETGRLEMDVHRQAVTSDGALTVKVGPSKDAFYGLFQEVGIPERNVPALHWLENSAREVQDEVLEIYYQQLGEALERLKG